MIRSAIVFLLAATLAVSSRAQAPKPQEDQKASDRAEAYYNYAMGHLYAELAGAYGNRGDYLSKAIEFYRTALRKDPSAGFLAEEIGRAHV